MTLKSRPLQRTEAGFNLIELMVVVGLIGILVSIVMPRFRVFQGKTRQTEAKTNLGHIFTLEQSYYGDNDAYASMPEIGAIKCDGEPNDLGFDVRPCDKARYTYQVPVSEVSAQAFTAHAKSQDGTENKIMPGCPADEWTIDQDKRLVALYDSVIRCLTK